MFIILLRCALHFCFRSGCFIADIILYAQTEGMAVRLQKNQSQKRTRKKEKLKVFSPGTIKDGSDREGWGNRDGHG